MDGVAIYHCSWTRTKAGEPKLKLFVTDQQGFKTQPVFLDFPISPFFYAKKETVEAKGIPPTVKAELVIVILGMTGKEAQVYRISTTEPSEITGLREFYGVANTFEADVPFGRRVMIARDLTVSLPSKRLYVDIETDGREGVPDEVEAAKRIISIAAVDQDGNVCYFSDKDEVAMISQFLLLMDKYPVVCTWYGNKFDWPYLQNRCRNLDIRFYWDAIVHVDLLTVLRDVMQEKRDNYRLEFIADHEELPHRKVAATALELWQSFEGDGSVLRDRNVSDSQIIRDLDLKYNMVPIMFDIAKATHTSVRDLLRVNEKNNKDWNPSVAVDGLFLTISGRRTPPIIWPSKEFKDDPEEGRKKFEGALVLDTIPGMHKNAVIIDAKALYPCVIRNGNIGPETYRPDGSGDIKAPIGSFASEPESVVAEGIRSVTELRERYRREKNMCSPETQEYRAAYAKEYAMKVLNNSLYGVSGSVHSRYFSKDVAENVTLTGQRITRFMKEELEALGYKVVLGDTDSVVVVLEQELDPLGTARFLVTYLTERGKTFLTETFHIKEPLFSLDITAICQSLFIFKAQKKDEEKKGTKKRYAGIAVWNKEPTFYLLRKGIEMVRHDSTGFQKELQEDMLWRKLLGDSVEEQVAAANEWKRRLLAGELNDKLVTWKGFGKHPGEHKVEVEVGEDDHGERVETERHSWGEYKVLTPAMRAAIMLMESGTIARVSKGDKVAYIKTGPKPEQVRPVIEGEPIVLTEAELGYIFDSQAKPLLDRLEIPVESEKTKYKPPRQRKAKAKL